MRGAFGKVQIGAAGKGRQRFVGGIAAKVSPQIQRVAGAGQKMQISPVGIIHQQQGAEAVANGCQGGNVCGLPQIIRAGDIHGSRCARQGGKRRFQLMGRNRAAPQGGLRPGLRPQPRNFKIQQGAGV